ncbi:MAG TPA: hypothetical protein VFM13_14780 [Gaiellaceae bacterium]|nr:hypothetical protein [Gaiellaceae bacterium]
MEMPEARYGRSGDVNIAYWEEPHQRCWLEPSSVGLGEWRLYAVER